MKTKFMVHRLSAVRKQEDLLFVCQTLDATTTRSRLHSSVTVQPLLQSKAAGQLSIRGTGLVWLWFLLGCTFNVCVLVCILAYYSRGHDSWLHRPLCLLAAARLPCWATSLRLTDSTLVGRGSFVATVTTSCLCPPLHTGLVFDRPCLAGRRRSKGFLDEERTEW